jgi:hypothetical protein
MTPSRTTPGKDLVKSGVAIIVLELSIVAQVPGSTVLYGIHSHQGYETGTDEMTRGIRQQLHQNMVALISLAVAHTGLTYNTWRNEKTEENRNLRASGFEIVLTLGELQQIVFFSHYDRDAERGSPRAGWTRVILLDDLSELIPAEVKIEIDELRATWAKYWDGLGSESDAEDQISSAIESVRRETLQALAALE